MTRPLALLALLATGCPEQRQDRCDLRPVLRRLDELEARASRLEQTRSVQAETLNLTVYTTPSLGRAAVPGKEQP